MIDYTTYDDLALMRAICDSAGNGEMAFATLYKRYAEKLYLNVLSLVKDEGIAQEIVQEIFLKVWQRRNGLSIESNVGGYLNRIGRNLVIDFFRRARRDRTILQRVLETASCEFDLSLQQDQEALLKEQSAMLMRAIASLPPQRRRIFELIKLEGKSYQQVAEELGIAVPTVKDHMLKAGKSIRSHLSEEGDVAIALMLLLGLLGE